MYGSCLGLRSSLVLPVGCEASDEVALLIARVDTKQVRVFVLNKWTYKERCVRRRSKYMKLSTNKSSVEDGDRDTDRECNVNGDKNNDGHGAWGVVTTACEQHRPGAWGYTQETMYPVSILTH